VSLRQHVRRLAAGTFAAALLAALGAGATPAATPSACGAATTSTIAAVDAAVTSNIYANELSGQEVVDDLALISGSQRLIDAVTSGDLKAVHQAASALVYHPRWHIVALRVLDAAGHVLADVGGKFVIAPVSGVLRAASGTQIGSFVMSVQDDLGVTKLENHSVGDPIGIYYKGPLVASLGARFPRKAPTGSSLRIGHVIYRTVWLTYKAYPSGTLRALLLVPPPSAAVSSQTCALVRANEFGRIAHRLTTLLGPISEHYYGYSYWVHVYTGARVFVRNPDGTQLAASDGSTPPPLPSSGSFNDGSQSWLVYSFTPVPPARVYLLVPPSPAAATAGNATATGAVLHG
jgi:hypothetical protein